MVRAVAVVDYFSVLAVDRKRFAVQGNVHVPERDVAWEMKKKVSVSRYVYA